MNRREFFARSAGVIAASALATAGVPATPTFGRSMISDLRAAQDALNWRYGCLSPGGMIQIEPELIWIDSSGVSRRRLA